MTERRTIYRKADGVVMTVWPDYDPDNEAHANWVPAAHLALGPPDPAVKAHDIWDGTAYVPGPAPEPEPIDTTPTALDVVDEFIRLGVKKGDGTEITRADLPQDWQDRMTP